MARHELFEEALTRSVIGAFFDVYNTLRFGFLEHIYAKQAGSRLACCCISAQKPTISASSVATLSRRLSYV